MVEYHEELNGLCVFFLNKLLLTIIHLLKKKTIVSEKIGPIPSNRYQDISGKKFYNNKCTVDHPKHKLMINFFPGGLHYGNCSFDFWIWKN